MKLTGLEQFVAGVISAEVMLLALACWVLVTALAWFWNQRDGA
jgi:hypothetical protein